VLEVDFPMSGVWSQATVGAGIADSNPTDAQETAASRWIKCNINERQKVWVNIVSVVDNVHLVVKWMTEMPEHLQWWVCTAAETRRVVHDRNGASRVGCQLGEGCTERHIPVSHKTKPINARIYLTYLLSINQSNHELIHYSLQENNIHWQKCGILKHPNGQRKSGCTVNIKYSNWV